MLPSARRMLPALVLGLSLATPTLAQMRPVLRPERTLFATAHVGFAAYVGDHDRSPFDLGYWQGASAEELPVLYGATVGYQFRPGLAASLGGSIGNYTTIWRDANGGPLSNFNRRYMADALVRMTAGARHARLAPYAELGVRVANGETNPHGNGTIRLSAGPLVGVDMAVTRHMSLLLGGNFGLMVPDANTDADDFTGVSGFGPFDLLGGFSAGLKYTLRGAITRPYVVAINGPEMLEAGQSGTFIATTNERIATGPVVYTWSFGDGTMAEGVEASHVYERAGSYTVLFTATSPHGTADATTRVEVVAPPVPPSVLAVQATPNAVGVREAVRFTARVEGDEPLSYAWAFGDGTTSTSASPSYAYTRPGTYTATLELRNARGRATGSTTVTVTAAAPPSTPPSAPACAIAELTSVFFVRGSSTLDARATADLRANAEALAAPECAATTVRVEGYAAPGEPTSLADARAQAVAAAYATMGMTRVTAMGMGTTGASTSKKEDTSQFRRADSIPQRAGVRSGMGGRGDVETDETTTEAPQTRAAGRAAIRTTVPGPGYVVVVGGAPSASEAEAMAATVGGDVRVLAGQTATGDAVYRVAVGHHASLAAARAALARVRAAGPDDAWLLRVR